MTRVPREIMWKVLENKSVREAYIDVIKDMNMTRVRTSEGLTGEFPIKIGLHQDQL